MTAAPTSLPPLYSERLRVPRLWWLIPVFDMVVLTVGVHAYLGPVPAVVTGVGSVALVVWALLAYGGLRVVVDTDGLLVGRTRLGRAALGSAWPLAPDQARALRGPRADARARLVLRGYIPTAVRVDVADPRERVPYWYVSTRRPVELAAALAKVRDGQS